MMRSTMATTVISLHLRSTTTTLIHNPAFLHHTTKPSSFSSYFSQVKATPTQTQSPSPDQIRNNLAQFRLRTAAPTSESPSTAKPFSFQEFYQREKEGDLANQRNMGGRIDIKAISENLRQFRANIPTTNQGIFSLKRLKESLTLQPAERRNPPFVMGSPQKRRESVELKDVAMSTRFEKMYSYKELGEELRKLRPEGDGFSLQELNERLIKLREIEEREIEERETSAKIGDSVFMCLKQSVEKLQPLPEKQKPIQILQFLNHLGQTPAYMEKPPKEHLVEKFFHPDNMSTAEKLKIELQKVREEFKMSESDCGSARVQVAQLTTKIKHLTTALHKKDTHSRKGLHGMIQQRKKLLKYLRRTDWDSYTLVLSKFGLRDNPDHKRLPTKEKKMKRA